LHQTGSKCASTCRIESRTNSPYPNVHQPDGSRDVPTCRIQMCISLPDPELHQLAGSKCASTCRIQSCTNSPDQDPRQLPGSCSTSLLRIRIRIRDPRICVRILTIGQKCLNIFCTKCCFWLAQIDSPVSQGFYSIQGSNIGRKLRVKINF